MKRGLSLHIGVNETDKESYGSTHNRTLHGCVNDAFAMSDVASRNGFAPLAILVDEHATFMLVEGHIRLAANLLGEGDTFMLTFSGHGIQLPSVDPNDGLYDEGIVLYDLVMKDNYINVLLRRFRLGCRVILVADSCYSGTIYRIGSKNGGPQEADAQSELEDREHRGPRMLFASAALRHWRITKNIYEKLDERFALEHKQVREDISADAVVLAACQENDRARDGINHGKFTETMLCLLGRDRKRFSGSYQSFINEVQSNIGNAQRPCVTLLGPNADTVSSQFFQGQVFSL